MKSLLTYSLLIGILGATCFACKERVATEEQVTEENVSTKEVALNPFVESYALEKEHIYNTYQVKKAREEATEEEKKQGKEKYDSALFACTEDKLADGEKLLRESILHYPDAVAYFELANILTELKGYEESIDAYNIAKQLDYKPLCDLYYNMACAFAMDDSDFDGKRRAVNHLRMAVSEGYANKAFFLKDRRLNSIRYSYDYNKMYLQTFAKQKKYLEQEKSELFVNLFPEVNFPYEIEVEELSKSWNTTYRLYDPLISFVSNKATYMPEEHFVFVAFLKKTPRYSAVIYAGYPANPEGRDYRYYNLVTYEPSGKRIAQLRFVDSSNPEKYKTGLVDENLNIEIKTYENIWKKNPKKYSYAENSIDYSEFQFSNYYRIDRKGKIVKVRKK